MNVEWMGEGLCNALDFHSDLFFPPAFKEDRTAPESEYYKIAKLVCEQCPVVDKCRELGAEETYGVWGGTSPKERRTGTFTPPTKTLPLEAMHVIPGHDPVTRVQVPELREALKGYTQRRPRQNKA